MFDPTVFDNLKVIVEGYLYDLDLENKISITNRNDFVDLATMSRKCIITFSNVNRIDPAVNFEIEMSQKQLAGELLQTIKKPGCYLTVSFQEESKNSKYDELLLKKLQKIWGEDHFVKLFITNELTSSSPAFYHQYQVSFQRTYGEDDLEELLNVVNHSVSLLKMMSKH